MRLAAGDVAWLLDGLAWFGTFWPCPAGEIPPRGGALALRAVDPDLDLPGVARPGGELVPDAGDLFRAPQARVGERNLGSPVQPLGEVREGLGAQGRVQAAGEADQFSRAVVVQQVGGSRVVADPAAPGQVGDLLPGRVLGVQHRAKVGGHRVAAARRAAQPEVVAVEAFRALVVADAASSSLWPRTPASTAGTCVSG